MNKREFTPEEIAKSLRACINIDGLCRGCVYSGHCGADVLCADQLREAAAGMIEAQVERIRELEGQLILRQSELLKLREENRFIPVEERLPDRNEPVLVFCENVTIQGGRTVHIGSCDKMAENYFWFLRTQPGVSSFPNHEWKVTHWKPMPKGPEVGHE